MQTLVNLVDSAFEYAYPLYAVACVRHRAVSDTANPRRHAPNTWRHERELSDHTTRWITTPNNDTLYSNAWVDLAAGPVRLDVARMPPGRYWSVAVMDAWTNHLTMLGTRLDGCGPASLTFVRQGHTGALPPGRVLRASGRDLWLFARCLVDGPEDLPQAHAMQEALSLHAPADSGPARIEPGLVSDVPRWLDLVNQALADNPPPAEEAALLAGWHRVGLRPGERGAWAQMDEDARQAWRARMPQALQGLQQAGMRGRRQHQGWITAGPEIGSFGRNHALRASVALGGLGALEPIEAMYFVRFQDEHGQALDGRQSYRMKVPAAGLPVDAFWSVSMYRPQDGQRYFVENPIARHSIGNRTPGLRHDADGSLVITLSHQCPEGAQAQANWLPAPPGPFQLSLRCYLPQQALRDLCAPLPFIERQGA